jgi:phosphoenolpyruvate carboxylase
MDHPTSNNLLVNLVYNIDDIPGLAPEEGAYASCAEFKQDLKAVQSALLAEGSDRLANGVVKDLLRLAETFGFHLSSLDIRQVSDRRSRLFNSRTRVLIKLQERGFEMLCTTKQTLP